MKNVIIHRAPKNWLKSLRSPMLHGSVRSYVHVRVLRGDDVCSGVLVAVTLLMVDTLDWTPLSLSSVTDSRLG